MLRVVLPLALLGIVLLGGGALYGVSQYLEKNPGVANFDLENPEESGNPLAIALRMQFEGATGAVTKQPEIDLRGLLPEAPEGWFPKDYVMADGEEITGETFVKSMVVQSTTNTLLGDFKRAADAGKFGEARSYIRGSGRMAIAMRVPEQLNENSVQGGMMAEAMSRMSAFSNIMGEAEEPEPPFATVDGIPFELLPRTSYVQRQQRYVPVNYRTFKADVGGLVRITLITNASDAEVVSLLEQIDMAAIHARIGQGVSGYAPGQGVQTASAELSDQPPGPGAMHRAFALVEAGAAGDDREGELIRLIAENRIEDWEDVADKWGPGNYYLTPTLASLLGDEPLPLLLAREAQVSLSRSGEAGELGRGEMRLLRDIKSGKVTDRAGAEGYLDAEDWHEDTRRVVALLPGDAPSAAVRSEPMDPAERPNVIRGLGTQSPGFTSGAPCTIENGVRRCLLTQTD